MKVKIPTSLVNMAALSPIDIFVVGGFVRNYFANLGETDIDLAGAGLLVLPKNYRVKTVNFRLGTVEVKQGVDKFEYTPFRTENYIGGNHTPSDVVFTKDLRLDAKRRDFTCNSVYYDIKNDEVIDPENGLKDIENKVLRARNPQEVFAADGLRLLRMVRIATETGFKIDGETARVAASQVDMLRDISPDRIREELGKILVADTKYGVKNAHYRGLKLLHKLGFFKYVLPPIDICEGVLQNPAYHKFDVLEHTFQTVRYAHPSVRLAALMHDLGKPYCLRQFGNMHGHEKVSAQIVHRALGAEGLHYSNDIIEETAALCLHHMYDMTGETRESKVKQFIVKNYDIIDKLILLIKADIAGCGMGIEITHHRFETIKENMLALDTPMTISDLAIGGSVLVSLGLNGEAVGAELRRLHELCVQSPQLNTAGKLMDIAKRKIDAGSVSKSESEL